MAETAARQPVRVARSDEVLEGGRLVVTVGGLEVGVFRVDGALVAYENMCPHAGGPVCQGRILPRVEEVLDGDKATVGQRWADGSSHLVCPWHGYEYDLRTGRVPSRPQIRLRTVEVTEEDGAVYLHP